MENLRSSAVLTEENCATQGTSQGLCETKLNITERGWIIMDTINGQSLIDRYNISNQIIAKIKDCIEQELENAKENPTPNDVDSWEFGVLDGREEFAQELKRFIKEWEKENE